jgi:hypothetical protein
VRFERGAARAHHLKRPLEIYGHDPGEVLGLHGFEVAVRDERGGARVVDQNIDAPELGLCGLGHRAAVVVAAHVAGEEHGRHAELAHRGERVLGLGLGLRVVDQDATALSGQRERRLTAYTGRAPRYNRSLARQTHPARSLQKAPTVLEQARGNALFTNPALRPGAFHP